MRFVPSNHFDPVRPDGLDAVYIFPIKKQMVVPPSSPLITEAKWRAMVRSRIFFELEKAVRQESKEDDP